MLRDSNAGLIAISGIVKVKRIFKVDFLENVLVDMGAEISSKISEEKTLEKPKRSAFVFITTESDASHLALEDLRKIDEVKEVYLAHGAYDLIAKVSGESFDHVREIVHTRIRNLSNVKSTLTLTLI
ncbi:MAG: Lrp/AsnC ligand binding domain-containing protein [Chloroflexi bacterium]|nr:Lrp/AsnC ligand binding domain-containing protein [Chloroflexota bacterium]